MRQLVAILDLCCFEDFIASDPQTEILVEIEHLDPVGIQLGQAPEAPTALFSSTSALHTVSSAARG